MSEIRRSTLIGHGMVENLCRAAAQKLERDENDETGREQPDAEPFPEFPARTRDMKRGKSHMLPRFFMILSVLSVKKSS